jgi:flagellar M-ring protein FliF
VPTFLIEMLSQMAAIWRRMSSSSRVAVVATLLLAVGGLFAVTFWARTPSLVVLESDLRTVQASKIVDALGDFNIPYETRDRGTTVLVPAGDLSRARLKLAGLGLMIAQETEASEEASPWLGNAEREALRIRKIQSELGRAIQAFKGLERVKVIISPGKDSPYESVSRPPSASIIVAPSMGHTISARQIQGIVDTAVHAVTGLTPENVSVVDGEGRPMTRRRGKPGSMTADEGLGIRRARELELEDKARTHLDRTVGLGHYSVAVTMDMSFDTMETMKKTYDPDGVVVSHETSMKRTTPVARSPGGVIGTGADGLGGGSAASPAKEEEKEKTNLVPETVTTESRVTPEVKKITVGITINALKFEGETKDLEQTLRDALGIDEARGDALTLTKATFATIDLPPAPEKPGPLSMDNIVKFGQIAAAGLVGLGLLLFFKGAFKRTGGASVPVRTGTHLDLTVGDEEEPEASVSPKVLERQKIKKEIARSIDRDPRGVAKLLEMWLHEESA